MLVAIVILFRSQDKDHQKEIAQLNKQARTDSQKQVKF